MSGLGNKFDALKMSDDSGDEDQDLTRRAPLEVPASHHRIQYTYCLWYTGNAKNTTFDQNLKLVGRFASVEQFWSIYSHCLRPGELRTHCDYHLFKDGVKPMWEDEANRRGGKWIVRLRKGLSSRFWENLLLAVLGEQFAVGAEVCGAVVSIRHTEDFISVWNRTASDASVTSRIRDTLRRVLNLPLNTIVEYKTHMDSLRDRSSFRNTDLFVK